MIGALLGDIRFACRILSRTPTFTAAVVATIALAVGSTAAILAVVDTILLRPLPFPDSGRVVALCETNAAVGGWCGASPMNVADWARTTPALESAGVARTESLIAQAAGGTYGVMGGIVTPGFFRVLRVNPMLGRLIDEPDLRRGSNQVAVISHEFWQRRAGSDPSIVGRAIVFDGTPFTIVGVLPAGAWMPEPFPDVQVWKPLTATVENVENRSWRGFTAIGRMKPGVSESALYSALGVVRAQLAAAYPAANQEWGLRIASLRDMTVGDSRTTLWTFLGTAVFVLLIACANVAGLLLVRAIGREAEFAVRVSQGAGRRRLVLQLMTENLVLSFAGSAGGMLLAASAIAAFVRLAPPSIPRLAEVAIDWRVASFACGLAIVTAMIFGSAPARRAWKTDVNAVLKGGRSGGRTDTRLRSGFAVVQLSLALMLLFGSGLLTRSFLGLASWDPGFDRSRLVTTFMLPPRTDDVVTLMRRVRDEVAAVPGVEAVALASGGPLFGGGDTDGIAVEGQPPLAPDRMPTVEWFDVDQHYFRTLGVRVERGRDLLATDTLGAPHVAVINQTLARRFFAGEDPIGRRVTVEQHPSEIVGVVSDVRPVRPDQPIAPQIYWPIQQFRRGAAYLVIRARRGTGQLGTAIDAQVAAVHPGIDLGAFVTLDERFARNLVSPRFNMVLVASFAVVAMILSAIGVYGVLAYEVTSRTRELGVRAALGATPRALVGQVARRGMALVAAGVIAGCIGAIALARLLASLLHGTSTSDPVALASAVAVLTLVAAAACWVPARRASRVNPVIALRAQ